MKKNEVLLIHGISPESIKWSQSVTRSLCMCLLNEMSRKQKLTGIERLVAARGLEGVQAHPWKYLQIGIRFLLRWLKYFEIKQWWWQHNFLFFSFIIISWRLITLQYCSGFCHTLTWISHGFTCVPHPDPPSHLPPHPVPLGLPSAPALSTYLMHPTWAGDLFHHR